jgi:hypothetical protein
MLNKTNTTYNIDKGFDYLTIKAMVVESLENISKMILKAKAQDYQRLRQEQKIIFGTVVEDKQKEEEEALKDGSTENLSDDDDTRLPVSLLKPRIRNTTEYLKWRIAILKRDNFKCQVCTASIKDNKGLRLEVHHAKTFNDIFTENNITSMKQALECNEIWSLDNGISLCYNCHKYIEKIRIELKNMFVI